MTTIVLLSHASGLLDQLQTAFARQAPDLQVVLADDPKAERAQVAACSHDCIAQQVAENTRLLLWRSLEQLSESVAGLLTSPVPPIPGGFLPAAYV